MDVAREPATQEQQEVRTEGVAGGVWWGRRRRTGRREGERRRRGKGRSGKTDEREGTEIHARDQHATASMPIPAYAAASSSLPLLASRSARQGKATRRKRRRRRSSRRGGEDRTGPGSKRFFLFSFFLFRQLSGKKRGSRVQSRDW